MIWADGGQAPGDFWFPKMQWETLPVSAEWLAKVGHRGIWHTGIVPAETHCFSWNSPQIRWLNLFCPWLVAGSSHPLPQMRRPGGVFGWDRIALTITAGYAEFGFRKPSGEW